MLVSIVQQVAMRSVVFCSVCNCLILVDAIGGHIVEIYLSIGLFIAC